MSFGQQFRAQKWATRDYKQGEIYLADDKKISMPDMPREYHVERPVVILYNHPLNRDPLYPLVIAAPLTTRIDYKHSSDLELFADKDGVRSDSLLKMNLVQPFVKVELSERPIGCLTQDAVDRMLALMVDLLGIDTSQ
ncbi:MAG: type II toxin-antitoxin system PemK/MazF family toxin [Bacillota bacterium]